MIVTVFQHLEAVSVFIWVLQPNSLCWGYQKPDSKVIGKLLGKTMALLCRSLKFHWWDRLIIDNYIKLELVYNQSLKLYAEMTSIEDFRSVRLTWWATLPISETPVPSWYLAHGKSLITTWWVRKLLSWLVQLGFLNTGAWIVKIQKKLSLHVSFRGLGDQMSGSGSQMVADSQHYRLHVFNNKRRECRALLWEACWFQEG